MAPVFLTLYCAYVTIYIMPHIDNDKLNHLLELTIGTIFGIVPTDHLEQILQLKAYESQRIKKYLLLKKTDTVIDLGVGPGFIADYLANEVEHIHCVDINSDFIQLAKSTLRHRANVTYHLIQHGKLDTVPMVSAIYANGVFMLFNHYDIYQYLIECYRVLTINGRMMFDIVNDESLDVMSERWQHHNRLYQLDPHESMVIYNSKNVITRMCQQIGFDVVKTIDDKEHTFFVLRKRVQTVIKI